MLTDCCWTLSYISDGSGKKIQTLVAQGVIPRLVELLEYPFLLPLYRNPVLGVAVPALRTLGGVLTGDDQQTQVAVDSGIIPQLGKMLKAANATVRKEAAWALSNITAGNVEQINAVIRAQIMETLIELAVQDTFDVRRECIWAISNASSGASAEQAQFLITSGGVDSLCSILGTNEARTLAIALEGLENFLKKAKELPGGVKNVWDNVD